MFLLIPPLTLVCKFIHKPMHIKSQFIQTLRGLFRETTFHLLYMLPVQYIVYVFDIVFCIVSNLLGKP